MRIFFLMLCAAIWLWACGPKESQNKPSDLSESGTAKNGDHVIDYVSSGSGDTTLLFVHGWLINKSYWDEQVANFSDRYRVIAIDLPGMHSQMDSIDRQSWTVENYASDLCAVISQLELENIILIGHSMGGDIILEANAICGQQVIGLIGVDNLKDVGVETDDATQGAINEFFTILEQNYQAVVAKYANEYLFAPATDSTVRDRVLTDYTSGNGKVAIASLRNLFDYTVSDRERSRVAGMGKKLILINSDVTPTDTTFYSANHVDFEILSVGPTGHFPMIENPELFNQQLRKAIEMLR